MCRYRVEYGTCVVDNKNNNPVRIAVTNNADDAKFIVIALNNYDATHDEDTSGKPKFSDVFPGIKEKND